MNRRGRGGTLAGTYVGNAVARGWIVDCGEHRAIHAWLADALEAIR